jgi:hypothetical protein
MRTNRVGFWIDVTIDLQDMRLCTQRRFLGARAGIRFENMHEVSVSWRKTDLRKLRQATIVNLQPVDKMKIRRHEQVALLRFVRPWICKIDADRSTLSWRIAVTSGRDAS